MEKFHLTWLVPIFYEKNMFFLISNHVAKGLTLKMA